MIRIGNQTAFAAARAREPFEYAVARGFDAFEWFPDKKDAGGWDETDLDAEVREQIRKTARQKDIRLSVHARSQANPFEDGASELFGLDLDLARELGAKLLNVHLFHEQGLAAYVAAIRPLLERTAQAGLWLAIENTPHHGPDLFNELFDRLRSAGYSDRHRVGMCLDLGHANLCAATRNDYLRFVDQLGPHVPIIHLHLHENWGDADTHLPLFTGPAAQNDAGVRGLLTRLCRRGFSGSIILEQWPQPPSLLDAARDRLKALLPECAPPARPTTSGTKKAKTQSAHVHNPAAERPSKASAPAFHREGPDLDLADEFVAALVAGDRRSRSWREKLEALRNLLATQRPPLPAPALVDIAIYLRFLGTGQIPCQEDGRHFRPGHHAGISLKIQGLLRQLTSPANNALPRRIFPWLPSSAQAFRTAEPLTRIRDIAHRNDIPSELKQEIKRTLQNKLHRCAGPEDLVTSRQILDRITAPGAGFASDFVREFEIFHAELAEFFNARSLEQQLQALLPEVGDTEAALVRLLLARKDDADSQDLLSRFAALTELRRHLSRLVEQQPGPETHNLLLADIALEDYAFVLLSELINSLTIAPHPAWRGWLDALGFAASNLALSSVRGEESRVIESELRAWATSFVPADSDHLRRLRATVDRCRRLAEDHSDSILELFQSRVETLGAALGVSALARRTFCEAEIRAHIVFQFSKLATEVSRLIRSELALPSWDVLVAGQATGRVIAARSLDALEDATAEPIVLLLQTAAGDEEIPSGIAAILLSHSLPHLSHLGVRARQAGVVFVTCEEPAQLAAIGKLTGQVVALTATPDQVEWSISPLVLERMTPPKPMEVPAVQLAAGPAWLELENASATRVGAKTDGARRLAELARREDSGFRTAPAIAIPFGIMEEALATNASLAADYFQRVESIDRLPREQALISGRRLAEQIRQAPVPEAIGRAVRDRFGGECRLMVRSSSNCEDLAALAGAGLYDSLPNVAPADIDDAVRAVWASLWTPRAWQSRRQAGIPHQRAHMAVLIQQMLPADWSFVLHTVNPTNRNRNEVYGEAAIGLGEVIVSGAERGQPYRWVAQKRFREVKLLAFANFSHALFPGTPHGIRRQIVDYSRNLLSTDADYRTRLLRRLANVGGVVEDAFGAAQDIEGVVVGDDIYLVQARPQQGLDRPA